MLLIIGTPNKEVSGNCQILLLRMSSKPALYQPHPNPFNGGLTPPPPKKKGPLIFGHPQACNAGEATPTCKGARIECMRDTCGFFANLGRPLKGEL